MKLTLSGLRDRESWRNAGIALPTFDIETVRDQTYNSPTWLHFGAGNIFRAFPAALQQELLNDGVAATGIIAAETFDFEMLDRVFAPHDQLCIRVALGADSSMDCAVVASITESIKADSSDADAMARLYAIAANPSLQMISFTITEKGYVLTKPDGSLLPMVAEDMQAAPEKARHVMTITAALLYRRFLANAAPIAVVSLDNCSHNGEKLRASVLAVAEAWAKNALIDRSFISYLQDESRVAFPWSMIDKITPRPDEAVMNMLAEKGVEDMTPVITAKGTYAAPFVNAERCQYLVVEDSFPNGRPALETTGVYFTTRDTVNETERMKVTTCLNPLHTAMSVYGCLLGYTRICDEMRDLDIVALIRRLGYVEGLPVVTDPKIFSPEQFLNEVINERLPNPFMPDAPQRIATDTSQKVGIRFGETIKSYLSANHSLDHLVALPLALAGWLRYLLGVDDQGNPFALSSDPLLADLQGALAGIVWNDASSYGGQLGAILKNDRIFGLDLTATTLAPRIEDLFRQQLRGIGAVRTVLHETLAGADPSAR